jgi:hypothetical protein
VDPPLAAVPVGGHLAACHLAWSVPGAEVGASTERPSIEGQVARVDDAVNAMLEVIGRDVTARTLLEALGRPITPVRSGSDGYEDVMALRDLVIADPGAVTRFVDRLPSVLRDHDVFADHPDLAFHLTGLRWPPREG